MSAHDQPVPGAAPAGTPPAGAPPDDQPPAGAPLAGDPPDGASTGPRSTGSGTDLDDVLDGLARLLRVVAEREQQRAPDDLQPLLPVITQHLGCDPRSLPVLTEVVPVIRTVDADVALALVTGDDPAARLIGVGGGEQRMHNSFSEILQNAGSWAHQFPVGAVDRQRVATGPDSERRVVAFGLHLLTLDGTPLAVLQRASDQRHGGNGSLEVLCASEEVASALLTRVRELMVSHSVLRGQVVSFTGSDYQPTSSGVTFLRRRDVPAADVVLPPGTLERIERQVLGVARHREALLAAGQHLKRGVLLYGPPGTGKTHTVQHLIGASPGTTVIVLAGSALRHVSAAAETARALQPSVVVLEDCDLIAEDRSYHDGPQPLLFEVLDALDGVAPDADVAFVLTTNRPDLLERALSQRPGRVDLAVEVPLPDAPARRRLFELYRAGLPLSSAALDAAAAGSEGVTASFVKEVIRRAVLRATEAGRTVDDDDLAGAVAEMAGDAERVTRSLLGNGPVEER